MKKIMYLGLIFVAFSCSQDAIVEENEIKSDSNLVIEANDCTPNMDNVLYDHLIDVGAPPYNGDVAQAVAAAAAILPALEGVTLYFREGIYEVDGVVAGRTSLHFTNRSNVQILGEGSCSVIRMRDANNKCSVRILSVFDSDNIHVQNILFDGNRSGTLNVPPVNNCSFEARHNIFIARTSNVFLENVTSIEADGDAAYFTKTTNTNIVSSYFNNSNRNGITFGGNNDLTQGMTNLFVRQNTFGSQIDTQQIDFEHGGFYENVTIEDNVFQPLDPDLGFDDQYAISLTALRVNPLANDPLISNYNSKIRDNVFNRNPILIRSSQRMLFANNSSVGQTFIDRLSVLVTLRNNKFEALPSGHIDNFADNGGIVIREFDNKRPSQISFENNDVEIFKTLKNGLIIEDGDDISVTNNGFTDSAGPLITTNCFFVRAQTFDVDVTLDQNTMIGFDQVIQNQPGSNTINCDGSDCTN